MVKIDPKQPEAIAWLNQFRDEDKEVATKLLDLVRYVSADEFSNRLMEFINTCLEEQVMPVALYAERPINKYKGRPYRLFKEKKGKIKRSYGVGPEPVKSQLSYKHETGSEGIVSNLITRVCKSKKGQCLNHPGPDEIRKHKVRKFIIVTDFIGTGDRVYNYLDSAWRLASVKSWASYKYIKFEVISFASIQLGVKKLIGHPARPKVSSIISCPTILTYKPYSENGFISLCERYGPRFSNKSISKLGYGGFGALIAFDHGMPNNAPSIFISKNTNWSPLFPNRVTKPIFIKDPKNSLIISSNKLYQMNEQKLVKFVEDNKIRLDEDPAILVLAALKRRPYTIDVIAERTGLSIEETESAINRFKMSGWVCDRNRLTSRAYKELNYMRMKTTKVKRVPKPIKSLYFPKELRAPRDI